MSKRRLLCLTLQALWITSLGQAAQADRYVTLEASRLWIEGRSNVNRFDCDAAGYDVTAIVHGSPGRIDEPITWEHATVNVAIPVDGFDCGNERMERDLEKALNAAQFPQILFDFIAGRNVTGQMEDSGESRRLRVWGDLSVAGERRSIDFVVEGSRDEAGRIHASGATPIRMSNFGVNPPRRFLGLVRVHDELMVGFDLILRRQPANPGLTP